MSKRKHVTLPIKTKVQILKALDAGECVTQLATKYGVGKSTICDIKKKRCNITQYLTNIDNETTQRKTLKSCQYPEMENALFTWILQERARHTPLNGELISEKAKWFYQQLTGKDDFNASSGWLDKFKKRHGIRQLQITGEKLSADESAIEPFRQKFLVKIREMGLVPDQIYNADESGLFYRVLPNKTLAHKNEKSAPGRKLSKDRITFMPCANATGTHKLKLLVIGKAKKPRAFKNVNQLPVVYKAQNKGWVTRELFREWFHEEFIPTVKNKMKELNLPQKALLCLDNAPGHPDADELCSKDKNFQTLFLPPNCTALIQPMDQHVIKNIKIHYRKSLLLNVISQENEDIVQILKKFDLLAVVFSLNGAWSKVTPHLIQKSWKNLWPTLPATLEEEEEDSKPLSYIKQKIFEEKQEMQLIEDLCRKIAPDITPDEVQDWVTQTDEDIQFTEDEIMNSVSEGKIDVTGNSEDENELEPVDTSASHTEAIRSFNICLNWCMKNNIPEHKYLMLKGLQEQAIQLRFGAVKQKKIEDYFKL